MGPLVTLTTLVIAAQLSAAPENPDRIRLWGNLFSGMTKAEVKSTQPSAQVTIGENCSASLIYTWQRGKLKVVQLDGNVPDSACLLLVDKTLSEKYGKPKAQNVRYETGDCGPGKLGDLCRAMGDDRTVRWDTSLWVDDRLRVIFQRSTVAGFSIYYSVEPVVTEASSKAL